MKSEGIDLNPPEQPPPDPYTESRNKPPHTFDTPSDFDKLKQFIELDRKVLRFYCVWDDRDNMFGEIRPYVSHKDTHKHMPHTLHHTHTCTCTFILACIHVCICTRLKRCVYSCVFYNTYKSNSHYFCLMGVSVNSDWCDCVI